MEQVIDQTHVKATDIPVLPARDVEAHEPAPRFAEPVAALSAGFLAAATALMAIDGIPLWVQILCIGVVAALGGVGVRKVVKPL